LDIIVLCRSTLPEGVKIEDVVAGMAAMVKAGKARHIGLSGT
jgi:aryl-alcohol dehydrogenase-like predicted oxidoreductase